MCQNSGSGYRDFCDDVRNDHLARGLVQNLSVWVRASDGGRFSDALKAFENLHPARSHVWIIKKLV